MPFDPHTLLLAACAALLLIAAGLLHRSRIAALRAELTGSAGIEMARRDGRIAELAEELAQADAQLREARLREQALRDQLDQVREERSQLGERARRVAPLEEQLAAVNQLSVRLRQGLAQARAQLTERAAVESDLRARLAASTEQHEQIQAERTRLLAQLAELGTTLEAERGQHREKLALLTEAREQLGHEFKSLAAEILEEKSRRFGEQNRQSLDALLEPLKERLGEFQGKVEAIYVQEGKDRSALAEQVRQLMGLNRQLSEDAHNLTRALRGSVKSQGNWGELILERVLEASGLRKGVEYEVQVSHTRDEGGRAQPDVIIRLPEGRQLVVDAKVSLLAYEEYVNAESETAREAALRRHLESVRTHVRGLAERDYERLPGLNSIDFVLMFLPVEPAFMLAVSHDAELWHEAWRRNVLLVSPSTLLFVVRTVAHLWRQEQQSRNAQEIARRGAELYDRLTGFVLELERVGERLRQAQESFTSARDRLCRNKGNVIRQAELLRELGLKPGRQLPAELVEAARTGEEDAGAEEAVEALS